MPFAGGAVADFGGKGEGGQVMSAAGSVATWAKRNGCGAPGTSALLAPVARLDPTRIERMEYASCPPAGQVILYTVVKGGHTWPGGNQPPRPLLVGLASRQMVASDVIVDFFLSQSR